MQIVKELFVVDWGEYDFYLESEADADRAATALSQVGYLVGGGLEDLGRVTVAIDPGYVTDINAARNIIAAL